MAALHDFQKYLSSRKISAAWRDKLLTNANIPWGIVQDQTIGSFFFCRKDNNRKKVILIGLNNFTSNNLIIYTPPFISCICIYLAGLEETIKVKPSRKSLNVKFPVRWIGGDGPVPPLCLFSWDFVKNKIYATNINFLENFKFRIIDNYCDSTELEAWIWLWPGHSPCSPNDRI